MARGALVKILAASLLLASQAVQDVKEVNTLEQDSDLKQLNNLVKRVKNATSMMAMSHSHKENIDIACVNFCLQCETGELWEIHRSQSLATKMAKVVGVGLLVGAIAVGLGPIAAVVGAGYVAVGGAMAGAHLANELHKESPFCPDVKFTREDDGVKEGDLKELKLQDLNVEELLLLDTDKFTMDSTKWAVACNYMVLSTSKWQSHGAKQELDRNGDAMPKLKADVLNECGKWLCNGGTVKEGDFACGGPWYKKLARAVR